MVEKLNKHPFFRNVRKYFKEYCNSTSIHGFKYFGENRPYFERGWWFIVFTLTLGACYFSIRVVYQKWIKSPVIVTFATTETPIYSIPFPAVTICPESKSRQEKYSDENILKKIVDKGNLSDDERELIKYMALVCDKHPEIKYPNDEFVSDDFYKTIDKVKPRTPIMYCTFMGKATNCWNLFTMSLTDEGICYTFNAVKATQIYRDIVVKHRFKHNYYLEDEKNITQWTIEDGYLDEDDFTAYPKRALLSGKINALSVILISSIMDEDQACKSGNQGFKVALHLPTRVPLLRQDYFKVPENEIVLAGVQPIMIKTSSHVEDYDVKTRKCYFSYEKYLKYFKVYTPKNCKLECLTNYTLYHCGCVAYFMPRENSTRICGLGSENCLRYAETRFQVYNIEKFDLNKSYSAQKNWTYQGKFFPGTLPKCKCLPTCSDLTYSVESSQSKWHWFDAESVHYQNGSIPYSREFFKCSKLHVFFKHSEFIYSQRNELYGPLDFLANFGGLLGLFTGFSLLSLMEAFYFLTLRIFCNVRMYGNWSGKEALN